MRLLSTETRASSATVLRTPSSLSLLDCCNMNVSHDLQSMIRRAKQLYVPPAFLSTALTGGKMARL